MVAVGRFAQETAGSLPWGTRVDAGVSDSRGGQAAGIARAP